MDILGIFDYLVENYNEELLEKRNLSRKGPVIIAGALSKHKAGYIYNLPENCNFNLYGINFEREKASSNTNYVGAFNPEELIYNLQGSLVLEFMEIILKLIIRIRHQCIWQLEFL